MCGSVYVYMNDCVYMNMCADMYSIVFMHLQEIKIMRLLMGVIMPLHMCIYNISIV